MFTTRPEIAAQASCLHIVVRGTPDSRYRQYIIEIPQNKLLLMMMVALVKMMMV
jgi:hypothetical protein